VPEPGRTAFKDHIGFFPGAALGSWKSELEGYKLSKGTIFSKEIRFPG